MQFLQEIATEQEIEVTYVDVEEKSVTGMLFFFFNRFCLSVMRTHVKCAVDFLIVNVTPYVCCVQWATKVMTPVSIRNTCKQGS